MERIAELILILSLFFRATLNQAVRQGRNNVAQREKAKQEKGNEIQQKKAEKSRKPKETEPSTPNGKELPEMGNGLPHDKSMLQESFQASESTHNESSFVTSFLLEDNSMVFSSEGSEKPSNDNYLVSLKEIIERKLQNIPDLACIVFLLSVYPLSIIRSATHFYNPYNLLASMSAMFPISLCLTEVKYALYLLMEVPVCIQKPSSLNKWLVTKIHTLYKKIGNNRGIALVVNSCYHLFVYALSQALCTYWFFFRSINYKGLTHAEHIKAMSENFEDYFDHNFAFNTSCRQYLR